MALLAAGVLASGGATADLNAGFTPAIIQLGAAARLDYTIVADGEVGRRGLGFSAELPAGLALADPALNQISCPGFVEAPAGGDTLVISELSLAAGQSCQISVHVEALAAGNYSVTSSELSGAGAPDPPATAELQVVVNQALLGITYSQASARWGTGCGSAMSWTTPRAAFFLT
ncbi:DUF7933 domain-containing protein [Kineobactrum salinum]|uniref:DUF7933 domain-containing protein n=1 Tax=Kineobactrum salinum TaxID=2708301 RepID=A0A6C0U0C2_9GAMM|nr:hypothetical protein [Kineobactrum salinum]QIB65358.1 hypothetical protein G3T16_08050 [Kineobactrum salinum]